MWYLDRVCSKHMTWDKSLVSTFTLRKGGYVSYGDNDKEKIIGTGTVGIFYNPTIGEVILVVGLKYNILSISKLYDEGNNITFDSSRCMVIKSKSNQTLFTISRSRNIYTVNLNKISSNNVCFFRNEDEFRIWHKRVAHIHMYI